MKKKWILLFSIRQFLQAIQAFLFRSSEPRRLILFFSIALSLSLGISDNGAVAGILFQSPASPPAGSSSSQPPPSELAPQPVNPAQPAPASGQPPAEAQPARQPPAEAQPARQPPAELQPAQPGTGFDSPVSPLQSERNDPGLAEPSDLSEQARSERINRDADEESPDEGGSRNFILDRIELVDTVIVSTAYVWLCCGIVLLLLIPLVFLFLHIRGRTKIINEEIP